MTKQTLIYVLGGIIIILIIFSFRDQINETNKNTASKITINNESNVPKDTYNAQEEQTINETTEEESTETMDNAAISEEDTSNNDANTTEKNNTTPPAKNQSTTETKTEVIINQEKIVPNEESKEETSSCDSISSFPGHFLCLLNEYRQSKGKNSLTYNANMNAAAQNHSNWMNINDEFSHTGENGSSMTDRCVAANTTCDAENLAWGATSAEKLLQMWQDSPIHNSNMLDNHTQLGFGMAGSYFTVVFQ